MNLYFLYLLFSYLTPFYLFRLVNFLHLINSFNNSFSVFSQLNDIFYTRPFKCEHCNFRSKLKIFLESHVYNKHKRPLTEEEDSLNTYKCHQCYRVYNLKRNLYRHLNTECGLEPKFQCPHCPYITKHRHNLQGHIKSVHKIIYIE